MLRIFTRNGILPATIVAMGVLLGIKSVSLVHAAAVANAGPTARSAPPAPADAKTACLPVAAHPGPEPLAPPSEDEQKLLLDLRKKSAALDARKAALDARGHLLQAAEKRLALRVTELKALDAKLTAVATGRKKAEDAKWNALVQLYQSMRPRQAATIFDGLAMPVLIAVVHRMNERKAAAIVAAMDPAKARALTLRLAPLPADALGEKS